MALLDRSDDCMKQHSVAFTLVEVLIALFILATTGYVLSSVQMRSFLRVKKHRESIARIFLIKKELYKFFIKQPKSGKPVVLRLENPDIRITSEMVEIPKKSSLRHFKDNLRIIQSEADWKDFDFVRREKMISFIYKDPDQKEKK